MRISACYIVKNEAGVLGKSLESLAEAVDEIVVVDTGSTDATKEIAAQYGAQVFDFCWQDDFAAARNFALERASGEWIVFLDADEAFSFGEGSSLRQIIAENQSAQGILVKLFDIDEDKGGEIMAAYFVLRIFRHEKSLSYEGRIHEELRQDGADLENLSVAGEEHIHICHTGYKSSLSRQKAERNLHLLLEELAKTDNKERLYAYLADAYLGMGDEAKALVYARMDVAGGRRQVTYASRSYRIILQLLAQNKRLYRERRKAAAEAVADFPELPEFHAEYAECLAYEFGYQEAAEEMEQALCLSADYQGLEQSRFAEEQQLNAKKRIALWQKINTRAGDLHISACLITKNEAGELGRWLDNVRVFADEIIVTDTGSTDDTVAIARAGGAKVLHFAWIDDFSAARNFTLAAAQGDWIVFIDTDEYFDKPECVRYLLAEVDCCREDTEAVMVTSPNIDADKHNREINRYMVARIFRHLPYLRYKDRIHESIQRVEDGGLSVFIDAERILLYHTGYSTNRIVAKLRRDLELLRQDIAEKGEQPGHYRYLTDCYYGLRQYEKALHYALLAIDSPIQSFGSDSDMYQEAVEAMRHLGRSNAEMLALLDKAIRVFPGLPDFYAEKGMVLCEQGKLAEAEQNLLQALQAGQSKKDQSCESSFFRGVADKVYCRLAKLRYSGGRLIDSEGYVRQALAHNKYNREALDFYLDHFAPADTAGRAALLAEFFATEEEQRYLAGWAELTGRLDLYFYYAKNEDEEAETLYELALADKKDEVLAQVSGTAGLLLQDLFPAIYLWAAGDEPIDERLFARLAAVLPDGMQRILRRSRGGQELLAESDYDAYIAALTTLQAKVSVQQMTAFAALALDFSWAEAGQAAHKLVEIEQWTAALEIIQQVPAEAAQAAKPDFWRDAGLCLYWQQQYAEASGCLRKAKALGYSGKDIEAYLQWAGEKQHD